jgi:hypothetical protein
MDQGLCFSSIALKAHLPKSRWVTGADQYLLTKTDKKEITDARQGNKAKPS